MKFHDTVLSYLNDNKPNIIDIKKILNSSNQSCSYNVAVQDFNSEKITVLI